MSPQPRTPTLLIAICFRSLCTSDGRGEHKGRNHLRCRGFQIGMLPGRTQRAWLSLAALCAAMLVWAAASAQSASKCDKACQARHEKLAQLRRQNALQKRPNVIVIDTDDMNV